MSDDLLELATALRARGEPFALATVIRCERPTSAKPGAKAVIRADGALTGWVGGACAEPVIVREALGALRDGRPRLVALVGEGRRGRGGVEGVIEYPMSCHSGGTLEIYVEPYLRRPLLMLVGHGPVIETLHALARTAGYTVAMVGEEAIGTVLENLSPTPETSVVVATHADADEDALEGALRTQAGYISLVASRRRAARILERLVSRGVPPEGVRRVRAPAGLDIGARTPQEIAVSILAEIVQHWRRDTDTEAERMAARSLPLAPEARDPVCGMLVAVATATYRSHRGGEVAYFCCRACKETFDRDPRHGAAIRDE